MRTVTFKSVLHGVASSLGLDPATNFTSAQAEGLTRYINKHLRRAWEIYPWPDLSRSEQRFFRDAYSAATTYALGAEVYGNGGYYQSLQAANLNHALTETAWWTPLTDLDRSIPLEQTGKTVMGEVFNVFTGNPAKTGQPIPFRIVDDAVTIDLGLVSVWVEYLRKSFMPAVRWG
jgi:hypothetical protein